MEPLLRITSTPMKYQLSIERARLELNQKLPRVQISRSGGRVEMQTQPTQMRLDTFEFRKSIGLKNPSGVTEDAFQRGKQTAMDVTGDYADFGNQILHIEEGANIPDTAFSQYFQRATAGDLVLLPVSPMDVSWEAGSLDMNYVPVNTNFDWNTGNGKAGLEFIPGSFSISIEQYPSLQIEFLGDPIYVPPSANPNFEAIA